MKSLTVAKRLIKQLVEDKRTIGMMLVAPVFVIYLLSIILNSSPSRAKIEIVSAPDTFISALKTEAEVFYASDKEEGAQNLRDKKSDGFINFNDDIPEITIDGSEPNTARLAISSVSKAMSSYTRGKITTMINDLSKITKGNIPNMSFQDKPQINYLYGSEDMSIFDTTAPMMMGFFIFFFVFLIAGVSFLRERISGTLDRILATPLKRGEIVIGYFFGFGIFVAIQTVLIQIFMYYVLRLDIKGSFFTVLLINIMLA